MSTITIKDIAKSAGVGLGTVSRCINGGKNVKRDTFIKVMNAAKRLNYKPNKNARNLARGHFARTTVGIIIPNITHPLYYEIVKGIYEGLKEQNFHLMIFNAGVGERDVFQHIVFENLAGLLMIAEPISPELKTMIEIENSQFVYLDHFSELDHSIYINNYAGGKLAAEYLLSKKCVDIAFIGENIDSQQQIDRFSGFVDTLKSRGVSLKTKINIPMDIERSRDETIKLLNNTGIDGIFYFCDELAYGGIKAKKDIDKELYIIGYDDLPSSRYMELTSIKQPAFEMGKKGAKMIIDMIENPADSPVCIEMIPKLIER